MLGQVPWWHSLDRLTDPRKPSPGSACRGASGSPPPSDTWVNGGGGASGHPVRKLCPWGLLHSTLCVLNTEGLSNMRAANPGSAEAAVNKVAGKYRLLVFRPQFSPRRSKLVLLALAETQIGSVAPERWTLFSGSCWGRGVSHRSRTVAKRSGKVSLPLLTRLVPHWS